MNKVLLFFILIFTSSCSIISDNQKRTEIIQCPEVFFSLENNTYVSGSTDNLDFDEIGYKASFDNYGFVKECILDSDSNIYNLEVLILIDPINPKNEEINLPIFVLMYDLDEQLIDKQYFRFIDRLDYNSDKLKYDIMELNIILDLEVNSNKKVKSITVGFVNIK